MLRVVRFHPLPELVDIGPDSRKKGEYFLALWVVSADLEGQGGATRRVGRLRAGLTSPQLGRNRDAHRLEVVEDSRFPTFGCAHGYDHWFYFDPPLLSSNTSLIFQVR